LAMAWREPLLDLGLGGALLERCAAMVFR